MANTYTLISSNVLGSSATSVTFSSIPSTYADLVLRVSCRADASSNGHIVLLTFNSITSGYSRSLLKGDGSTPTGATASAQANIILNDFAVGNTATASTFSNGEIYIPNYAGSTNKPVSNFSVTENNATEAYIDAVAGLMSNTAAITSITLTPNASLNFLSGSSFYLYGIKSS
jgi:hypothetical protein